MKNKQRYQVFLRLLAIYFASQKDDCFGFVANDGELDNIVILKPDSTSQEIVWECLFNNTENNKKDGSFNKTLYKIIKLILRNKDDDEIYKIIVGRNKGVRRESNNGYLTEKLNNLEIKFNEKSFQNFQSFTLSSEGERSNQFSKVISDFKNAIIPLISP